MRRQIFSLSKLFFCAPLLFFFCLDSSFALAPDFPIPELSAPVIDEAQIFSSQEYNDLSMILREFKSKGVQMAVYVPASLHGYDIEGFSIAVAEKWKLGRKGVDKGLLLLVAPSERKMRLEVGYGLEGDITDAFTKRLLDDGVRPYFRAGHYSQGILFGVVQIAQKLNITLTGDYTSVRDLDSGSRGISKNGITLLLLFIFFVLLPILRFLDSMSGGPRRMGGGGYWGGGFGGGGGGWGGSSGSGGGYSGGGGGFGGGGASSDW